MMIIPLTEIEKTASLTPLWTGETLCVTHGIWSLLLGKKWVCTPQHVQSYCTSCYSHCCDQMLDKRLKGRFILAYSLRGIQSILMAQHETAGNSVSQSELEKWQEVGPVYNTSKPAPSDPHFLKVPQPSAVPPMETFTFKSFHTPNPV